MNKYDYLDDLDDYLDSVSDKQVRYGTAKLNDWSRQEYRQIKVEQSRSTAERQWSNASERQRFITAAKTYSKTEQGKAQVRRAGKAAWDNAESAAKLRQSRKDRWNDPAQRAVHAALFSKYVYFATNIETGEIVIYKSKQEIVDAGWSYSKASKCCNNGKEYDGYTWRRETK